MNRIVVSQFVSLDGVVEDPAGIETLGRGAWSGRADSGPEGGQFKVDELQESRAMLLGRKTYESYAAAWPTRDDQFADRINAMPKYVVSSTLADPEWDNTTVLEGDAASAVRTLKGRLDGDILVHGSVELTRMLMAHDLVDEWRLMVFPIVVGDGRRCFGDPGKAVDVRLVESRAVGDGVAIAIYEPVRG